MVESKPVETGGKRVQILAYIDKVIAPPNPEHVGDDFMPNQTIGYVCDVSVYVRDGMKVGIADHYGDGVIRKTFEDAQHYIWEHTRVMVEPIPGAEEIEVPKQGSIMVRVGRTVVEYQLVDRPRAEIESENPLPNVGDTPWWKAGDHLTYIGKKTEQPIQ